MATSVRVMCVNKSDRYNAHERIINIGGVNPDQTRWKMSQQDAIKAIETGKYSFYVVANDRLIERDKSTVLTVATLGSRLIAYAPHPFGAAGAVFADRVVLRGG